jgi:hypothetical protein
MAALTPVIPTVAGTLDPGAAVASSDTINVAVMGPNGCYLEVINAGGSPDNVTISDAGVTPAGVALAGGTFPQTVTNGTSRIFWVRREQVNQATGLVTITHSFLTSVTYKLYTH